MPSTASPPVAQPPAHLPMSPVARRLRRLEWRGSRQDHRQRMKIYTRTGDDGTTGLIGGGRVHKSDPRIECYGTVDELNAALGLAAVSAEGAGAPRDLPGKIREVQADLF